MHRGHTPASPSSPPRSVRYEERAQFGRLSDSLPALWGTQRMGSRVPLMLPWAEASLGVWAPPPLSRLLPLGAEDSHTLTLLRPGPPQAKGNEGDDDEDDRAQDDPDNQVGQVTGTCHHGPCAHWPLDGFREWQLRWGQSWGWEPTRLTRRLPGCNCEQNSSSAPIGHVFLSK